MYKYRAKVTRVIDGDTFIADVRLGFNLTAALTFRVLDLDTPETRTRNADEKVHGVQATVLAKTLLLDKEVTIDTHKSGKYGRWLAQITLPDGTDYVTVMLRHGMAKRVFY
ncbi:MAG: thermonuclease family protein [Gammaproteobacteria bacterium]|nr:thermonuclease family protein [Gammaproteobacteria bacterium]